MRQWMKNRFIFFAGLSVLSFIAIHLLDRRNDFSNTPEKLHSRIQNEMHTAEKFLRNHNREFTWKFLAGLSNRSTLQSLSPILNDSPYRTSDFVFSGDSMIFWSDVKIILPDDWQNGKPGELRAFPTPNGWICLLYQVERNYLFLSVIKVYNAYTIENEYLRNGFTKGFKNVGSVEPDPKVNRNSVLSLSGGHLFSLKIKQDESSEGSGSPDQPMIPLVRQIVLIFLFLLGNILFTVPFLMEWKKTSGIPKKKWLVFLSGVTLLLIIRLLQSHLKYPGVVYQTTLFRPDWYSSSALLSSPGDLLMLLMLVSAISGILLHQRFHLLLQVNTLRSKILVGLGLSILLVLVPMINVYLVEKIILDSSFSLDFQNIAQFSTISFIGLFLIILITIILWYLVTFTLILLRRLFPEKGHFILFPGVAVLIYLLMVSIIFADFRWPVVLFLLLTGIHALFYTGPEKSCFSFQNIFRSLLIFSLFQALVMNHANAIRTQETVKLLASRLGPLRNPIMEERFRDVVSRIQKDTNMQRLIKETGPPELHDSLNILLKARYFTGFWKRYNIQITVCKPGQQLLIQPRSTPVNCSAFFNDLIDSYGIATGVGNLWFLDYGYGSEFYISLLNFANLQDSSLINMSLILEFSETGSAAEPGYPGLLLDRDKTGVSGLWGISYGLYRNRELIHCQGDYQFPAGPPVSGADVSGKSFDNFSYQSFFHFRVSPDTELFIISDPKPWYYRLAPFSYLFLIFSLIAVLISVFSFLIARKKVATLGLRIRLPMIVSGFIVATMLLTGIIQVIWIIDINRKKNIDDQQEKGYSVQTELGHKFGNEASTALLLNRRPEDFLIKLANVFFTDINLFDPAGNLMASSRIRIFNEGLVSRRMNYNALISISEMREPIAFFDEKIGRLSYTSVWLPLINDDGKLLAYINLPSFARQDAIKREVAGFLVAFANIYIFVIIAGVLLSILISKYITRPFNMLSVRMARLKLGKSNEKLTWGASDEIGELVEVYNRMVDDLDESARQLAASEREQAWKTMARQVAHEIKNPLTPMKLSAQHLQRAFREGAGDMEQRIDRFTRTLVEQIDALAAIASDFSNFARMPAPQNVLIAMDELTSTIVRGYPDTGEIEWKTTFEGDDFSVLADRSRMIRILTNLLNNAMQSLKSDRKGEIRVTLRSSAGELVLMVADNGEGIPPDRSDRIFVPDFTTKSGGMGLGLAIVKGIITEMSGEISFVTNETGGTTFIVSIPKSNKDQQSKE